VIDFGIFDVVSIDWAQNIVRLRAADSHLFKCKIAAPADTLSDDDLRKLGAHLGKTVRLRMEILPDQEGDI
jgi:hypothetical protein